MKKGIFTIIGLLFFLVYLKKSALPKEPVRVETERVWGFLPYEGKLEKKEIIAEEVETGTCDTTEETVAEVEVCKNRWGISLSEEEKELLAKIVWIEAAGEPVEGQQAVVEVVFNRMRSEWYPDTLYEVLGQEHPQQFCSFPYRDRAMPTEKEYQSIEQVLNGETDRLSPSCIYFSTFPLTDEIECKIGGHYFCD